MADFAAVMARRRAKEAGAVWADEVIAGLFLGSGQDASNLEQINRHGVNHVINVADDVPNYFEAGTEGAPPDAPAYLSLNVGDFGTSVILLCRHKTPSPPPETLFARRSF